jgi:glyoxylase-like metal-dependent hydrolase (beta-lactamase superfamily II)
VFAWLQPDGGWGWSNAGLLATDDSSLLVDTLFDLKLTRAMLDAMAPITDTRPIGTLVNTHANGDHCYGNSLVTGAEVVTTEAAAREMGAVPPSALVALMHAATSPMPSVRSPSKASRSPNPTGPSTANWISGSVDIPPGSWK